VATSKEGKAKERVEKRGGEENQGTREGILNGKKRLIESFRSNRIRKKGKKILQRTKGLKGREYRESASE